ncbi:MAG TPA: N-acetylmuramoyl-L-alanine amidase [Arenibaculum sp.]|nr:N-acetylmuramoyl-L-alanine amidase [Arenibaculum sp.]
MLAWLACALLAAQAAAASGRQVAVLDARLGVHPDKTRFVLDLTDTVDFRIFTLPDPYRVVVDFPNVAWMRAGKVFGAGVVSGWRHGRFDARTVRLVLDVDQPVRVREAFVLPPRNGRQARFVLDLEPVTHARFALEANRPHGPRVLDPAVLADGAAPVLMPEPVSYPVPPPLPSPLPPLPASLPLPPMPDASPRGDAVPVLPAGLPVPPPLPAMRLRSEPVRPMIAIDAGHGGTDPGAISVTGQYEKNITLSIARELRRQLAATGRYRVAMIRDGDEFLRLRDRVAKARAAGADLFISLHADSIGSSGIRGMSVYTLSDTASDREAEMLAARENRADALGGIDLAVESDEVASILIDLAQRDARNHSRRFANLLVAEMGRELELLARPHRSAGFAVLTAPDVPSVLVELGYLSSPKDAKLLGQAEHQSRIARAVLKGIDGYFSGTAGLSRS